MRATYQTLPVNEWPVADRIAWQDACRPALRLLKGGSACGIKPVSRTAYARAYGYLLDFCLRTSRFDPQAAAAGHVTPAIMDAFVAELQTRVGSIARYNYLSRIERMARLLAPGTDTAWLKEVVAELEDQITPRSKVARIVSSARLLELGLDLVERAKASTNGTNLQRARLHRDGLMIAMLALCPIRLKNFASIQIGKQLRKIDDQWWIMLASEETKTGRADERPLPTILTPIIDQWIDTYRPAFLRPGDALWVSTAGGAVAYTYVGAIITETTRRELGIAVNPHLFRDCAVFTVAHNAGREMGIASALLQHTDHRVTDKHYNRGAIVEAVKSFHRIVLAIDETA
ncbi:site-specific integrase [Mesorhizobium sp. VNQ89]|uniref:site-specific integrase n=1 Tax=Mesorhizobium quangtriensis TaxID=3157709 RepID=UPI0032B7FF77